MQARLERNTGRTTAMLREACRFGGLGQRVDIVVHNRSLMESYCRSIVHDVIFPTRPKWAETVQRSLRFMEPDPNLLLGLRFRPFVDHFVYDWAYDRYPRFLEALEHLPERR